MLVGIYNKSVIITYIGVASAVIGMWCSIHQDFSSAMILLMLSGLCDMFDGKFARMCKRTEREKTFGIEIDSLSDMVGFVIFPVTIAFSLGVKAWYHLFIIVFYTLAAITRLGFFNVMSFESVGKPLKYYSGLPVTSTSVILPIVWFIFHRLDETVFLNIYIYTILTIGALFILNIKVLKPKGIAYLLFAIFAVAGSILILINK